MRYLKYLISSRHQCLSFLHASNSARAMSDEYVNNFAEIEQFDDSRHDCGVRLSPRSGCQVLCSQLFCAAFSERVGANTDTAWRTTLCMTTSISGLTAPRGCLVRFLRRRDIDFEHPRGTFQLTMHSPGRARPPKSNATPSVGAPGSISLHDAASAQRDIARRRNIARRRINLFSGEVVLVQCFVAA